MGLQIIHNQVYLAAPADCPVHPDGSKRKGAASGGARAHSRTVELMVSDDGGSNFQEACIPIKWLDLVGICRPCLSACTRLSGGAPSLNKHIADDSAVRTEVIVVKRLQGRNG